MEPDPRSGLTPGRTFRGSSADHGIAYRAIRDDLGDLDAFRGWALGKVDSDEP